MPVFSKHLLVKLWTIAKNIHTINFETLRNADMSLFY